MRHGNKMRRLRPVLWPRAPGEDNAGERIDRKRGEASRAAFRRKCEAHHYHLIDRREQFHNKGICALFHPQNLEVVYFSESLSEILPLLKADRDFNALQRLHDRVSRRYMAAADADNGVQFHQFWELLLALRKKNFLVRKGAHRNVPCLGQTQAGANTFTSLIILPSLRCNFRCDYCYHRVIPNSEKTDPVLSSAAARQGIDYFLSNTSAPDNFRRSIRFSGGEPMLHYELVRDSVAYTAEIGRRDPSSAPFLLSMITNASLVDDRWIELIKRHSIDIGVSLDGRKPVNDLRRRRVHGSAYESTAAGIRRLNAAGVKPALLMTVSGHNVQALAQDIAWLWEHFEFSSFSYNLDTSFIEKYRLPPEEFAEAIVAANDALSYRGLFEIKVTRVNTCFQSKQAASGGCGGVFTQMVLFPDGSVGPCPRLAGDASQKVQLDQKQSLNSTPLFQSWCACDPALNTTCQRCNYFNICEPWCPYVSLQVVGRKSEPNDYNCRYTEKLLEWLIWYDYEQILSK